MSCAHAYIAQVKYIGNSLIELFRVKIKYPIYSLRMLIMRFLMNIIVLTLFVSVLSACATTDDAPSIQTTRAAPQDGGITAATFAAKTY